MLLCLSSIQPGCLAVARQIIPSTAYTVNGNVMVIFVLFVLVNGYIWGIVVIIGEHMYVKILETNINTR